MDVNTLRVAVMLAGFVLFMALMAHTWSKRRRQEHEEASLLPFRSDTDDSLIDGDQGRTETRGEKL